MFLVELFNTQAKWHTWTLGGGGIVYEFVVDKSTGEIISSEDLPEITDWEPYVTWNRKIWDDHDKRMRKARERGAKAKEINDIIQIKDRSWTDGYEKIKDRFEKIQKDKYIEYQAVFLPVDKHSVTPEYSANKSWEPPTEHTFFGQFSFLPKKDIWEFHFSNTSEEDKKSSIVTGTGYATQVFSAVLQIFNDAKKSTNAKHIVISAFKKEPSRIKLYDRLLGKNTKKRWEHNNVVYWLI